MRLFWDAANWQPSCNWHHVQVKQRLEVMLGRGLVDAAALRLDSPDAIEITNEFLATV